MAQPQSSTDVLARAELDRSVIVIGDQLWLQVTISAPPNTEVMAGDLQSSKDATRSSVGTLPATVEIVDSKDLNTVSRQPELLLEQRWLLQPFDTGYVYVPAIGFPYRLDGATRLDTAFTEPLLLTINGVPVNDQSELEPIKPIIKEQKNWQDFWPLYLALLLALSGFLVWRYLRYRNGQRTVAPPPPPKPAHLLALEQLDALESKQLWQSGDLKGYYSELSRILRVYLEARFQVPALESTTKQIARALAARSDFETERNQELGELLQLSDLVKFARATPVAELHATGMQRVRDFVLATVPQLDITPPASEEE
jgi:hypothetical protein